MDKNNLRAERKQIRMPEFSYSENRIYFITICSKDKKPTFGRVVGYGACDVPKVTLSAYGNTIEKAIHLMDNKYNNVFIDHYVIMPNHIHMLIVVSPPPETERDKTARVSYFGTSQAPYPTENNDLKITLRGNGNRANEIIPKFISLFKRCCNHEIGYNIWQRRYYDHVIRSYREYENAYRYINNNPAHWAEDEYYQ
ncbi:transposase [uncultured Ruminococcus sp.]|uniref:transposase n=1 Tax=uncultured Ruminococcus sp. TaxID=165186 RepID=UPI00292E2F2D|nr:transposase [uncultured Ruminococcus sp.]